jgi:single-strand DNA-binding protein
MNKIIITGRLVRDPELRTCNNGTEVCNFALAVDRRVKKDQEKKTDFIDCTAWGKTAVFVNTYLHKGDGANVEGRMEGQFWMDHDGKKRVSWSVTVDNIEFPHGRSGSGNNQAAPAPAPQGFAEVDPVEDDGELPF